MIQCQQEDVFCHPHYKKLRGYNLQDPTRNFQPSLKTQPLIRQYTLIYQRAENIYPKNTKADSDKRQIEGSS